MTGLVYQTYNGSSLENLHRGNRLYPTTPHAHSQSYHHPLQHEHHYLHHSKDGALDLRGFVMLKENKMTHLPPPPSHIHHPPPPRLFPPPLSPPPHPHPHQRMNIDSKGARHHIVAENRIILPLKKHYSQRKAKSVSPTPTSAISLPLSSPSLSVSPSCPPQSQIQMHPKALQHQFAALPSGKEQEEIARDSEQLLTSQMQHESNSASESKTQRFSLSSSDKTIVCSSDDNTHDDDNDTRNGRNLSSPIAVDMSKVDETKTLEITSPNSEISTDNEEESTDNFSCGKSDSSAESPNCKSRKRSGSLSGTGSEEAGNSVGNPEKKVYHCQHCKYTTDRKNNLKRHVVTMHEVCAKTLECCDVVFKNKASLREHVISCHKNGYDCRVCGRTFCRKALLKRHITVHSGQKDYVCGVCGYATSHKSNLDRHKRRHGPKYSAEDNMVNSAHPSPTIPLSTNPLPSPPQKQPFTLKPNPLDVCNLVSNHNNSSNDASNHFNHRNQMQQQLQSSQLFNRHQNRHHYQFQISPNYGRFMPNKVHRPEPIKVEMFQHRGRRQEGFIAANRASNLPSPAGANALDAQGEWRREADGIFPNYHRPWSVKKHRPHGRLILAKRLLHTYRQERENELNSRQKLRQDSDAQEIHKTEVKREENSDERKVLNGERIDEHGDHCKLEFFGGFIKKTLTKRLVPSLYMCRKCSVVFENQLQLTSHFEKEHREEEDCTQVPQRPLTLQARPRAW